MSLQSILTYTVLGVSLLVTAYVSYRAWKLRKFRLAYSKQNIPYVELGNMFLNLYRGKRPELLEHEAVQKNGKVFGTDLFGSKTIYVTEPEIIQQVLSKEFTNFTNRRKFKLDDDFFNAFLSTAEDERWKRIRAIVTPTFSAGKVRRMKPRIDDTAADLVKNIEQAIIKSEVVNIKEFFNCYTLDTIIQVAFGTKVDSLSDPDHPIIKNSKKIFSRDLGFFEMIGLLFFLIAPKIWMKVANLFGVNWIDFFKDFSNKIIKKKREELKAGKGMGKADNFLELLLEAEAENQQLQARGETNENGVEGTGKVVKYISENEMLSQCILFFIAGFDTTASNISLASYQLALNPDIQERLYEEIESNLAKLKAQSPDSTKSDPIKLVTFESIAQFEYLTAVVNETLRMYPPAPVERQASKDIHLQTEDGSVQLNIAKDDVFHVPVYSLHHNPAYFPDPERFDPERFLTTDSTFHKYAYMPFGNGPRNCVARSLALLEAKMALLNVVHKFKLSRCAETKVPVEFYNNGQILSPKDVRLKVELR